MKPQTAPRTQRGTAPVWLPVNTVDDISFQMEELSARIARRAHDCFEARGGQHGDDLGDWLRAEQELVHRMPSHSQELEDRIELDVEVPQSDTQNLHVSVEPRRLLIRSAPETEDHEPDEPTSARQHSLFHVIDLPFEIDVESVTATLNEGKLRVTLPKQMGRSASIPNPNRPKEEEQDSAEVASAYLETGG